MEKAKRLQIIDSTPPIDTLRHRCMTGLLAALLLLTGCSRPDPEQQLRAQWQAMQRAVEEKRPDDFMEAVSEDFTGNDGADRAALHQLLRMQLGGNVGVSTGPLQVQILGSAATVRFTVLVSSGRGRFVPDSGHTYNITSGWREEEGQWRVYYAQWKPDP